jgi:hypothetical protein
VLLCTLVLRLRVGPLTIDDAFITFRYARNLAEGAGFVYNLGQHVLGTTTPLYATLMAALYRIGVTDLPSAAWVLNALLDAGTAWMLYVIGRRLVDRTAGVAAALLFACAPMGIAFSAGGMEGSLFVFMMVAALLLALNGHLVASMALLGLDTLVRPEAALAAIVVLLVTAIREKRLPLREGLAYGLTLAPWLAFATWYFGSPIPQSMSAKSTVYAAVYQSEPWINALALVMQAGLPGQSLFLLRAYDNLNAVLLLLVAVALPILVGLAISAGRRLIRANPAAIPWVLFPLLYALAYAAAGARGVRMFHWYIVPLVPFYALLLAVGLRTATGNRRGPVLGWAAFVLVALWWTPSLVSPEGIGYPVGFTNGRERLYEEVATDYDGRWDGSTLLALPEIGAIGYHTRARVLDTVGLVSPSAVRYYPIPNAQLLADNAVPSALIRDARPDYVVTLDRFIRGTLVPDSWFFENYQLVEARELYDKDVQTLLVYRRADSPSS